VSEHFEATGSWPHRGQFTGIDILARKPDANVLLVIDVAQETAAALFPDLAVLGVDGFPKPDTVRGRKVIVWGPCCHDDAALAQSLSTVAAKVAVVHGERNPMTFDGSATAARHWLKTNLRRFEAVAPAAAAVQPEVVREAPATNGAACEAKPAKVKKSESPTIIARKATRERTEGTSWADFGLVLNDDGIPVSTLDNCVRVIEHHPDLAGKLWYDTFLGKIVQEWGVDTPKEWSDYDDVRMALFLQRDIGIPRVSPPLASFAVVAYAHRESRNCAYDWLDALQWDGKPRLQDIATKGFGALDNLYNRQVCRNLLLAMVKRVFSPGCKSDYMPVFEGPQGEGKSKALAILGGDWFAELHMDWNGKDFYQALQGKMLLEIGELHAFKQSDVDRIKGIVSCPTDRYRVSFGRHVQDHPRHCVFAGTTNRDDWNRDDTGARRFWPIVCGAIDHNWLRTRREQLFAEAVHDVRAGKTYWEVPWNAAKAEQENRRPPDAWDDKVADWVIGKNTVRICDLMIDALGIELGRQTLADQQRAGRCMRKLGWTNRNVTVNGKQQKCWCRSLD